MNSTTLTARATAACLPILVILALATAPACGAFGDSPAAADAAEAGPAVHPSFLHGRVTTVDGDMYEGRIRFGGSQEAFWGDHFNGFKDGNPWIEHVPDGALPGQGRVIRLLGFEFRLPGNGDRLEREFMVRFGDIAKLEARGRDLTVTLKSGRVVELDRYSADDFADGVRVWDADHGVVDLHEREVRSIEFLASGRPGAEPPYRLHGTVHTLQGAFTGYLQWGMEGSVGLDELDGRDVDGELVSQPFVTIRSITRLSSESARVTLLDGSELVLSDTRDIGQRNRGIYVDDARYGRVLVSWNGFDRVDLTPAGAAPGGGPVYDDFLPGRPLAGTVIMRTGRRYSGRLVYDLDESEVTESLDAPSGGVHYTIPFGLVAAIDLDTDDARARVLLRSGEALELERSGDLGDRNAGVLVFGDGGAEYVRWGDVVRVVFGDAEVG